MNFMVEIILIITLTTTWTDYARPMLYILDYKPFNCSFCLTFWISIIVFFITFNPIVLSSSLILRIIERRLL